MAVDVPIDASYNVDMKTLSIECPDSLAERLEQMVREGWVADQQQAMIEALRRFLDSHRPELIESQVLADVEWGLHGKD
jgi:metal-responsive CopG/Arc/MetJ family transcriptional regulator